MRILESTTFIHTDGVIHVDLDDQQQPKLSVGTHVHDAMTAAGAEAKLQAHPVQERLLRGQEALRSISVKVLFDDPKSNIHARYEAWGDNPSQGPLCMGNGDRAKHYNLDTQAWEATPCRGPGLCPIPSNKGLTCSLRSKFLVSIVEDGESQGVFEFRSSAENTYRAILGNLQSIRAKEGSLLNRTLQLHGWTKSTQGSSYLPFACATVSYDDAVEPVAAVPVDDAWEALGKHTQETWLAECIPTESEKEPLSLPLPKATVRSAIKAPAVLEPENLFAQALNRLQINEQRNAD